MMGIELETERLKLKLLSIDHLSNTYVSWMNDEEVTRYLETGGNYTIDLLEIFLKEQEEKNILFWAIHIKDSNKHIGNLKIDPINTKLNSGEFGIMMGDKTEWGKGYAEEASLKVINYCFNELKLSQITLGVIVRNIKAIQLYKKMGFEITETIKNYAVYEGIYYDSIRMLKKNLVHKLVLGTVQLGLDYGINNASGKPSIEKAFKILNTAFKNGIKTLDTAEAYGDSQEVIGKFHKKNPKKKFNIITKLAAKHSLGKNELKKHILLNLDKLSSTKLYGYMFHNYQSFKKDIHFYNELIAVKKEGLVEKIGISLYSNEEILDIITNYSNFDFIQVPFNLLDNQFKRKNILLKAQLKNIEIHSRSVFLQGLFFRNLNELPEKLTALRPYLEKIKKLKEKHFINTETLALQYTLQKPYIDNVLIGVEDEDQLLDNINICKRTISIPHSSIDEIKVKEEMLLNPSNWLK
jgi:aryl-alcohol dehydrogenase-like predicted oxidoreductase